MSTQAIEIRKHIARSLLPIVRCALISLTILPAFCQMEKAPVTVHTGQIVTVQCDGDASQSYALYLPVAYTPQKRWPMIYFFDPMGRGSLPLELYKDLAEKYGFVIAGSNNSRNFSADEAKAVNTIWRDTHLRLSIDEHRTYAAGFSGGARVSGSLALTCVQCQIAGVIAHGAGYPNGKVDPKANPPYFFAIGDQDFNWPEIMTIRREREEKGLPYRVREFSGQHQWAPAPVMEEGIEWITLKAMQGGTLSRDPAFIDRLYQETVTRAQEAETKRNAIAQLNAYRSLASDFSGLKDVTEWDAKLAALKKSPALKSALRAEQDLIREQRDLESEISEKLQAFIEGSGDEVTLLHSSIQQAMGRLRDQAAHAKDASRQVVYQRAFAAVWAQGIESGQQELESRHYEKAETYFQLMSEVRDTPWPVLLLAETHASAGNRKQALKDLQEVVRRGLKDPSVFESDSRLQVLHAEPDFQKLMADLRRTKPPSQ